MSLPPLQKENNAARGVLVAAVAFSIVAAGTFGGGAFRGQVAPSVPVRETVIVDNADPGFTTDGQFYDVPKGFRGSALGCNSSGTAHAYWTATGMTPGTYDVWVTYPIGTSAVRHSILDGTKLKSYGATIHQGRYAAAGVDTKEYQGATWVRIARPLQFNASKITVALTRCNRQMADAVMLERITPAQQSVACDDGCVERNVEALVAHAKGASPVLLASQVATLRSGLLATVGTAAKDNASRLYDVNRDGMITAQDAIRVFKGIDARPVCGNAARTHDEACDDGNAVGGDGCTTSCTIEPGYRPGTTGEPSVVPICGDGLLVGSETCDDGGRGGCDARCSASNPGYACINQSGVTECRRPCGNAIIDDGEECDAGEQNGDGPDAGCSSICTLKQGFRAGGEGEPPVIAVCGDGIVVGNETCDGDAFHSQVPACDAGGARTCVSCQADTAGCFGNGAVGEGEECDDGNTSPGDGCFEGKREAGYACPELGGGCATVSGDGLVRGTETCDDGNTSPGDGCGPTMQPEGGYACEGEPSVCTSSVCGNGIVERGEACDTGHSVGMKFSGCSATCTVTQGYLCSTVAGEQSACGLHGNTSFAAQLHHRGNTLESFKLIQQVNNDDVVTRTVVSMPRKTCEQICSAQGMAFDQETTNLLATSDACSALYRNGGLLTLAGAPIHHSGYYANLGCFSFTERKLGAGGYYPTDTNAYSNRTVDGRAPAVTSSLVKNYCGCN